ncbi:hypothetical protein B0H19DRAFT_1070384 [Mycena capillaripes]|nr:hypothetical protein B0H19DRAFT_1070384 [Mycena capillaripes]
MSEGSNDEHIVVTSTSTATFFQVHGVQREFGRRIRYSEHNMLSDGHLKTLSRGKSTLSETGTPSQLGSRGPGKPRRGTFIGTPAPTKGGGYWPSTDSGRSTGPGAGIGEERRFHESLVFNWRSRGIVHGFIDQALSLTAMSLKAPKHISTNLPLEDLVMNDCEGGKDGRYYCLPPYHRQPGRAANPRGGGYPYHLVSQGHKVGIFDNWLEAKASLTGYPNSGNYDVHSQYPPLPVRPTFYEDAERQRATFVNMSPRKGRQARIILPAPSPSLCSPKREGTSVCIPREENKAQVLADFPICLPPPSPSRMGRVVGGEDENYVNFAIRGDGIVLSSPMRTQERYLDLQRRGEQPDMLVTRSFVQASLFALDDETAHRRRRQRAGLPPVKPGKVGWVHGTKLVFFKKFKDDYLAAAEIKETGTFYSCVTQEYLKIYGYNIPWDGDLEDGQEVADDVDPDKDVDSLMLEEAEEQAVYYKKLRGIYSGVGETPADPPLRSLLDPLCGAATRHGGPLRGAGNNFLGARLTFSWILTFEHISGMGETPTAWCRHSL